MLDTFLMKIVIGKSIDGVSPETVFLDRVNKWRHAMAAEGDRRAMRNPQPDPERFRRLVTTACDLSGNSV